MRHYKVKPIQSLERGLHVLAKLREMRAASLHDLHQATGIPKPTLTRILYTLYRQGLVWQRMADGAFLPSHLMLQRGRLDDTAWLVEIASPVLERLCERVMWPSVLSVPRLDHMEVVETNSPRAYFDELPAGPIGFRANVLRSASGRAYLAFCPDAEREAVLRRLRDRDVVGHELAHDPVAVRRIVAATRRRGYSVRAPDFGGHYSKTRRELDDGRSSIAMPVRSGGHVLACVNLTWRRKALTLTQVVDRYAGDLRTAVTTIEGRLAASGAGAAESVAGLP
ncbi:MAG TPA: helix-turn-helix domain-containing protein [Streptosporangiaceae bacterium]|jgi:IclR family mhp operon transcriptional activator